MSLFVSIPGIRRNGTLYVGMTDDLLRSMWEHREGVARAFTQQYGVKCPFWYEVHETRASALPREQQIKKWNRIWKLELIDKENPSWRDRSENLTL